MKHLLFLLLLLAPPAFACGPDTPCPIGERHYRISMPPDHDGTTKIPALIWSHGYGGSAKGVMRNGSLRRMLHEAGFALIAAHGENGAWHLPNGPGTMNSTGAAEFAYFDAVIADATQRFAIDPTRLIASGFSAGGMMVWNLACARPKAFAGFIPISGTFWLRPPETCTAPAASIIHIHGDADKTVPLKGRAIGKTKQGEVGQALDMYAAFGEFGEMTSYRDGALSCTKRANPAGDTLDFCLFSGGHSFRTEFLRFGIQRLNEAGQL